MITEVIIGCLPFQGIAVLLQIVTDDRRAEPWCINAARLPFLSPARLFGTTKGFLSRAG